MIKNCSYYFIVLLWCAGASAVHAANSTCYRSGDAHQCLSEGDPKAACEQELNTDPYNLMARFSLCEAYVQQNEPLKAWIVLDQGVKICGRNRTACSRLQIALSNLEEASEKDAKDNTALQRSRLLAQQESQRRVCQRRMNGDMSLNACNELLITFPEDAPLYTALGSKLLNRGNPAEALLQFRQARKFGAEQSTLAPLVASAQSARQALATRCLGESNLDQCNRALLVGGADEAQLQVRRAKLLRNAGNTNAAIEALTIAQTLKPRELQISKQLLALLPKGRLSESRFYLARGQAQAATGAANKAIKDLTRALAMGAAPEDVKAPLQRARTLRKNIVQQRCLAQEQVAPCERLRIAGEPDERTINAHIASINDRIAREQAAAIAAREPAKPPSKPPEADQQPERKPAEDLLAANTATDTTAKTVTEQPSAVATPQAKPELRQTAAVVYKNQASELGITY